MDAFNGFLENGKAKEKDVCIVFALAVTVALINYRYASLNIHSL